MNGDASASESGQVRGSVWRRLVPLVALGSGLWCVPFLVRLASVDERNWIARDDGVITLSHARNFADHGSIGVSPGGDRVEGFSSPLHFAVGVVIELFGDPSARTTTLLIFGVFLALSGAALTYGTARLWRVHLASDTQLAAATLVTLAVVSTVCAASWTTTGWLASGMENPIVLAAGACVVAMAVAGIERPSHRAAFTAATVAFLLSRVEFAAFAGPLALAMMLMAIEDGRARDRGGSTSLRGELVGVVRWTAITLAVVGVVHVARRWYFGAWLPNTAIVQDRDAGADQVAVIASIVVLFGALVVRAVAVRGVIAPQRRDAVARAGGVIAVVGAVGLCWLDASGRTAVGLTSVLVIPGVLPFGGLVASALFVRHVLDHRPVPTRHWVLAAVVLVPLSQYVVTGAARLEDNRVSGLAVPFLVVWATVALVDAGAAVVRADRDRRIGARVRTGLAVASVGLLVVPTAVMARADGVRALPFEIAWADEISAVVAEVGDEQFDDDVLVITANHDLGKVSHAKRSSMVDLGWLGDPLLATLRVERPDLLDRFVFEIARPDVVSTSGGWSCEYRGVLEAPGFVEEYRLSDALGADPAQPWVRGPETCPNDGRVSVWIRVLDRGEYSLTRALTETDRPDDVVRGELDRCGAESGDALRCQYVRRSVQRVMPLLRDGGSSDAVISEFENSPSAQFDIPMLRRGPGWWRPAAVQAIALLDAEPSG